jgi:hypothetical protein
MESVKADLDDPHRARGTLDLIRRAVMGGWRMSPDTAEWLPARLEQFVREGDPREAIRAAEVLARLRRDNIDAMVALHRIERLEAGDATEIVQFPKLDLKAK